MSADDVEERVRRVLAVVRLQTHRAGSPDRPGTWGSFYNMAALDAAVARDPTPEVLLVVGDVAMVRDKHVIWDGTEWLSIK